MKLTDQQIEFFKELDKLLKKYGAELIEPNVYFDQASRQVVWGIQYGSEVRAIPSGREADPAKGSTAWQKIGNWPEGIEL